MLKKISCWFVTPLPKSQAYLAMAILFPVSLMVGVVSALNGCSVLPAKSSSTSGSVQYVCKEGPDEKCPDATDYMILKEFHAKYSAPTQEQDAINGMWIRLRQNPPDGFFWPLGQDKFVYQRVPKGQHWDKRVNDLVPDMPAAAGAK